MLPSPSSLSSSSSSSSSSPSSYFISFLRNSVSSLVFFWLRIANRSFRLFATGGWIACQSRWWGWGEGRLGSYLTCINFDSNYCTYLYLVWTFWAIWLQLRAIFWAVRISTTATNTTSRLFNLSSFSWPAFQFWSCKELFDVLRCFSASSQCCPYVFCARKGKP